MANPLKDWSLSAVECASRRSYDGTLGDRPLESSLVGATPFTGGIRAKSFGVFLFALICYLFVIQGAKAETREALHRVLQSIVESHCLECHAGAEAEGDLNLERMSATLLDGDHLDRWVLAYDRVRQGEMPPRSPKEFGADRPRFLASLGPLLHQIDQAEIALHGRGSARRLTRSEFEHNLRDLLSLPELDVRDLLPPERTGFGYTKVAASLDMSRVQLSAFLDASEAALRAAMATGVRPIPPQTYRAEGTDLYPKLTVHAGRESMHFSKHGKMVRVTEADLRRIEETGEQDSELEMALFRSATWPFYGYPRGFRAEQSGRYRVRFRARAVRQLAGFRLERARRPVPMTFRARQPSAADVSGDVRATGGIIDVQPEGGTYETLIELKAGEVFEYSLLGLPVPHPITSHGGPLYYNFPPMPPGGHRGIAFQWLEVMGPMPARQWPPTSHQVLFGDLAFESSGDTGLNALPIRLIASDVDGAPGGLVRRFIRRAARMPLSDEMMAPFEDHVRNQLSAGHELTEALVSGFQAFLSSRSFLRLEEPKPDSTQYHYQIASRLSHLLWDSRPDEVLMDLAQTGRLNDSSTLRAEVDRLIADERFERFIEQFAAEWLELRELRRDSPDIRLFPEYRKDDYLVDSLERETRAFLLKLFRENRSVSEFVDSDFLMVNDRLSRHYGLDSVAGSYMRAVEVPKQSPYGGILTQGSILKLTANGTTTSPVLRGAWVADRLLGEPPPPPPTSVPALEPDLRGRSTVREILEAHTSEASCAACHARFDPYGFALESFDVMGAWRDHYRSFDKGDEITGIDRAGHRFAYRIAQPVDSSGHLMTGEAFQNIEGLREILENRLRQLAKNFLQQLTLYGTGAPVRFSEREVIEAILDDCRANGFSIRDLLKGLVQSRIFLGLASSSFDNSSL